MTTLTRKQLIARIDGIGTRATTITQSVQDVGILAALWMQDGGSGDTSMLTRLLDKIDNDNGLNAKAFILWCETYFAVRVVERTFKKAHGKVVDMEGACANPWHRMKKDTIKKDFDIIALLDAIEKLTKKASKIEDGERAVAVLKAAHDALLLDDGDVAIPADAFTADAGVTVQ